MFTERTSVGLDVHARSVVAAAIDGVTGELIQTIPFVVTVLVFPSFDTTEFWVLTTLPAFFEIAQPAVEELVVAVVPGFQIAQTEVVHRGVESRAPQLAELR